MIANNISAHIRPAAVAGMFYPGHEKELRNTVRNYLQSAEEKECELKIPLDEISAIRMLIVPHAGYIYSGKTAAFAYQLLQQFENQIQRVLMLGPAHRVLVTGAALPEADSFETPLGQINLDRELMEKMLEYSPKRRLKPLAGLMHPFFDDLRLKNCKINGEKT